MDLLLLGGIGYAISKLSENNKNNNTESMSINSTDSIYSNESHKIIKNDINKKALKRKQLKKEKKVRIASPVKASKKNLLLSVSSEEDIIKSKRKNSSNLESNYSYQNQFDSLKYDCKEPMALNGLDRDELIHVMGERDLFSMGAPIKEDMTYNVVNNEDFCHNNMQKFTKMNGLKHDEHTWKNRNSLRTQHCGLNEFYQPKKEAKAFFKPQKDVYADNNINISNVADRFIAGKEKRNQLPFDQIKVTPGLNLGYDEDGKQGFHDTFKPKMKDINELRGNKNKQVTYTKPMIPGKKGIKAAIKPKIVKRRPNRVTKLKHGANTRKVDQLIRKNYQKKKFIMPITERGKKKKTMGIKGGKITKRLPESRNPEVRTPFKSNNMNPDPSNIKGRQTMYEPKMQNFVMPCTQRNSTNVPALPGPIHKGIGSRVRDGNGLKPTLKQTILYNREGIVKAPYNKGQKYDPNDKARTTRKEQNLYERDGNIKAPVNKRQEQNDKLRVTLKQQNLFKRDGVVKAPYNKGQKYDPKDKPRVTKKDTMLFNREGAAKAPYNKPQPFNPNDIPKITIKQTTIENKHKGNMRAFEQPTYQIDYNDVPAQTLKELLVAYQRTGIAKGVVSKSQMVNYNDIPAQTLKELVINNKYIPGLYSVAGAKGGYLSNNYQAPATLKQALNDLFYVGSMHSSKIGGYVSNKIEAKTTLRQMLHVFRLSGIGKQLKNHRLYGAEYNAETNAGREKLAKGRAPTTRKQDVPIGGENTNIRKKSVFNSARAPSGVNPIVGRPKFNQRLNTRPVENKRNDLTIASSQLKNNIFAIKRN
jgi:hypothetical protein